MDVFADALGFLSPPKHAPVAHPELQKYVQLMHVTAAPPNPKEFAYTRQILQAVNSFRETIEGQPQLKLVMSPNDLKAAQSTNQTGIVLGLQMAPYDCNRRNLRRLFDAGIRVIGISYQGTSEYDEHPLGGGFLAQTKPLTDAGKRFIMDCSIVGLIVDLSHSGHQTARDVVAIQEDRPTFMASHGGLYERYQHPRNLPADVLVNISEKGGIVGVYGLTFGLSTSDDSARPMYDHLIEMLRRVNRQSICIGSDGVYKKLEEGPWRELVEAMRPKFDPTGTIGVRWPDHPLELNGVNRLQKLEAIFREDAMPAGWAREILGNNLWNFFLRALPA